MTHIRLDVAENERYYPVPEYVHHQYYDERQHECRNEELICRLVRIFSLLLPQILAHYYRSSRRYRSEDSYYQHHQRIDQRYCRDSGLTYACDHHRVQQPHRKKQELLHEQRPQQLQQISVRKQPVNTAPVRDLALRIVFIYFYFFSHTPYSLISRSLRIQSFTLQQERSPLQELHSLYDKFNSCQIYEKNSFMESRKLLFL